MKKPETYLWVGLFLLGITYLLFFSPVARSQPYFYGGDPRVSWTDYSGDTLTYHNWDFGTDATIFRTVPIKLQDCYGGASFAFNGIWAEVLNCDLTGPVNVLGDGAEVNINRSSIIVGDTIALWVIDSVDVAVTGSLIQNASNTYEAMVCSTTSIATTNYYEQPYARVIGNTITNLVELDSLDQRVTAFYFSGEGRLEIGGNTGIGTISATADNDSSIFVRGFNPMSGWSVDWTDTWHSTGVRSNSDIFFPDEIMFADTDENQFSGCAVGNWVDWSSDSIGSTFLHSVNLAGNTTIAMTVDGVIATMNSSAGGILCGDSTNTVSRIRSWYAKVEQFTGTENKDTVVVRGAATGDVVLASCMHTSIGTTSDVLFSWVSVNGDTIFVTRGGSGTSGLKYGLQVLKVTVQD